MTDAIASKNAKFALVVRFGVAEAQRVLRTVAALYLCLASLAAQADHTMLNLDIASSGNPNAVGVYPQDIKFDFARIVRGGDSALYSAGTTCTSGRLVKAVSALGLFQCTDVFGAQKVRTTAQAIIPETNWLSAYGYGGGQFRVLAARGGQAVVGASKTSDLPAGPCLHCVSAAGIDWGFNDKTDSPLANWARYVENRTFSGSGGGVAQETEVTNFATANDIDPFGNTQTVGGSLIVAHHTGSGGGCGNSGYLCYNPATQLTNLGHANPASAYYDTIHNGAGAYDGLIFFAGSIEGALGYSGFGRAITMTYGHELVWDYCNNPTSFPANCAPHKHGAIVSSAVNVDTNKQFLLFSNLGMTLSSDETLAHTYLQVPADSNYVNYAILWPSAAGMGILISPGGKDAHVNLQLAGKGAGVVATVSKLNTAASGSGSAGLNIPHGAAPSAPLNGDIWSTASAFFVRISGATRTLANLEGAQTFSGQKTFQQPFILPAYTVATLPNCDAGMQNTMAVVTDARSPTYNGALTGGGDRRTPVFCDGSAWTSH